MPTYPNITDENFYDKVNNIYSKYKVKKEHKTLEKICYPKEFKLQLPQQFLSEFINPKTPYMGILVYHRIGSGKTCTSVRIAEKWKKHKRIVVVVPASLKNNYRNELRSLCAEDNYLKEFERNELIKLNPTDDRYKEIIDISNERIDKYYEIYSYNKFVELINAGELNLKNTLLIVDEIQNMVSEGGTFYNTLYKAIHNAPRDLRIVLLSATPMFDKPHELALTMNLLRLPKELPIGREFDKKFVRITKREDGELSYNVKNTELFKKYLRGYISYFRGAAPIAFPRMNIKYVKCEMSEFQYSAYLRVLKNEDINKDNEHLKEELENLNVSDLPNNFYIGTRVVSNVVFPNKKINSSGFRSFTDKKIKEDLEKYSCKFFEIINRINKCSGKVFVYSSFKEYGGLKSFIRVLEAFGYSDYTKTGVGKKRFAVWSGDENITVKEQTRTFYNMKNNLKGGKIKVLLGSSASKEGLSLTAVRQAHVLEPYWNKSRLDQVIGRASRFCSHKDVEEEKRKVNVYIYTAVAPGYHTKKEVPQTIDQYIYDLSLKKNKLIMQFEKLVKEVAVDCNINKNANVYEGDDDIVCDT
jgi:superfamily II DNA or RNA helicase